MKGPQKSSPFRNTKSTPAHDVPPVRLTFPPSPPTPLDRHRGTGPMGAAPTGEQQRGGGGGGGGGAVAVSGHRAPRDGAARRPPVGATRGEVRLGVSGGEGGGSPPPTTPLHSCMKSRSTRSYLSKAIHPRCFFPLRGIIVYLFWIVDTIALFADLFPNRRPA